MDGQRKESTPQMVEDIKMWKKIGVEGTQRTRNHMLESLNNRLGITNQAIRPPSKLEISLPDRAAKTDPETGNKIYSPTSPDPDSDTPFKPIADDVWMRTIQRPRLSGEVRMPEKYDYNVYQLIGKVPNHPALLFLEVRLYDDINTRTQPNS